LKEGEEEEGESEKKENEEEETIAMGEGTRRGGRDEGRDHSARSDRRLIDHYLFI
tara:strand:- start:861 stop:1025 length:165 start_codon:yes stop_codon:yes gene_type:complete